MVSHGQFPPSPMAWLFSDHKVPIGFGLPAGGVTHDRGVGRTVGLGPALGPSHHRHGQLRSIFGHPKRHESLERSLAMPLIFLGRSL